MAPQSGKWAITPENLCGAVSDFPPGRRKRDLKPRKHIGKYIGVALASPDRKITGSGTHGYY
jgi:hypothetical protein